MKQVSVVGSGNVGTNTAFFLAENRSASVTLIDVKEGISTGKALDLMEAGPLRGYDTYVRGSNSIEAIAGSDVVVLAAGRVRKPGEDRVDLYHDNAQTVEAICKDIVRLTPNAVVVNCVEPVDLLTLHAQKALGFDRKRVLGVGGLLSSTRLRYLVAAELDISPREVTALVIGPHRPLMVVLRDSIRVSGIPAEELIGREKLDAIIEEVRVAGDTILKMAQWSTAYYAPSAAACSLIEAITRDRKAVLPVSMVLDGEYGVRGVAISVPARVGISGVESVQQLELTDTEQQALRAALDDLVASRDRAMRA
jgi:malate dehydrogenase